MTNTLLLVTKISKLRHEILVDKNNKKRFREKNKIFIEILLNFDAKLSKLLLKSLKFK